MRKSIGLYICLCLMLALLFAVTASAETYGDLTYTVSGGKVTITGCSATASGALVIPTTLGGYPVTSIRSEAFYDRGLLTSITIPSSVTSIGDSAFYGCSRLTSITIPSSVTSIGGDAFSGCSKLQNTVGDLIYIQTTDNPYFYLLDTTSTDITSCEINENCKFIGRGAFESCSALTSISIPSSVTSIGSYAFSGCTRLQNTVGNLIYIQTIDNPYFYLQDTTSTTVTSCKINENCKFIGDEAFYGCSKLTSIEIPSGVTSIGRSAFEGCSALTSIEIPSSVTSIGERAFRGCSALTSVTFAEGSQCTSIGGYAFEDCSALTSISIPSSVTSIGDWAFSGCSGLKGVYITDIAAWCGIAFGGHSANPLYYAHNLYLNNELITDLVIPSSVTSIGDWAFYYCSKLTSISIPSSVTSIGGYAFFGCSKLTSIEIPSSVTSIGGSAFEDCSALTSIAVDVGNPSYSSDAQGVLYNKDKTTLICCPGGKTECIIPSSVTSIGDFAFYNCSGLTSIEIPSSVTSIGNLAFSYCGSLTSIEIPSSVTSIGYGAFWGCRGLTSIEIPSSVTSIGWYAFSGCSALTSIEILNPDCNIYDGGDTISYTATIYGYTGSTAETYATKYNRTFVALDELSEPDVPDALTYKISDGEVTITGCDTSATGALIIPAQIEGYPVTSIGDLAFEDCFELKGIRIPSSVTSIGDWAFAFCYELTNITIPSSVTSIGENAFWDCSSLTSIPVNAENASYSSDAQGVLYNKDKTELICCPGGTLLISISVPSSVTSIREDAFYHCRGLASIIIPSSVTIIGWEAFWGCSSLASIMVDAENPSYSNDAHGVLYSKDKTELICCPGGKTECEIPSSVTRIAEWAFSGCSGLASITVDAKNSAYSSDAQGVLYNKDKTELICCPGGKTECEIPSSVMSIGDLAFEDCFELKGIEIPSSVTSIGWGAFENCNALTSIEIPSSVTSIGWDAFQGCRALESITIPSSVTSIGDEAFYNCSALESIEILNPDCEIYASSDTISSTATIYGYVGSTAETYAKKYHRTFVALDASAHTHDLTPIAAVPATCTEAGNNAYYYCAGCGTCFADADATTETTVAAETIPAAGHTGGEANCTYQAVCTVCGEPYGELDANKHNVAAWTVTKAPTVDEAGTQTGACAWCGKEFTIEIAKLESAPIKLDDGVTKLVPSADTFFPEDAEFFVEKADIADLDETQKAAVDKAADAVKDAPAVYLGEEKIIKDAAPLCLLDLSLQVHNQDGEGSDLGYEKYHFDGEVEVILPKPDAMKAAKNPRIVHIKDDGVCEPVAFTDNGETISFKVTGFSSFVVLDLEIAEYLPGDVNGDGAVTSDDAIHLLYYTLLPDLYSVNQPVDFNGDGDVTSDDAIYLLYYTLLPDLYPLHLQ